MYFKGPGNSFFCYIYLNFVCCVFNLGHCAYWNDTEIVGVVKKQSETVPFWPNIARPNTIIYLSREIRRLEGIFQMVRFGTGISGRFCRDYRFFNKIHRVRLLGRSPTRNRTDGISGNTAVSGRSTANVLCPRPTRDGSSRPGVHNCRLPSCTPCSGADARPAARRRPSEWTDDGGARRVFSVIIPSSGYSGGIKKY